MQTTSNKRKRDNDLGPIQKNCKRPNPFAVYLHVQKELRNENKHSIDFEKDTGNFDLEEKILKTTPISSHSSSHLSIPGKRDIACEDSIVSNTRQNVESISVTSVRFVEYSFKRCSNSKIIWKRMLS